MWPPKRRKRDPEDEKVSQEREKVMGMFDHVYYKGEEFQTKDFDCVMDLYYISRKRLY